MKKWFKLTTWARLVTRTWLYLKSPIIPLHEKLLLLIPIAIYWVIPDVMPYLPFDDIAITVILANWFIHRIERKFPELKNKPNV